VTGHRGRRPPLTVEQVLAWADAHHARTGRWPHANTGAVPEVPGLTWNSVNLALYYGYRAGPPLRRLRQGARRGGAWEKG
jgi:hypothetical protein